MVSPEQFRRFLDTLPLNYHNTGEKIMKNLKNFRIQYSPSKGPGWTIPHKYVSIENIVSDITIGKDVHSIEEKDDPHNRTVIMKNGSVFWISEV